MTAVFKAIDLFAGIGGIHLGFKNAGFEIIYANEIDKYCCQTYRTNLGNIDERDIRTVVSEEIPDFDVLLAGFPCQPFSMAGNKKGLNDPRGNLFFEIERILRKKRPTAIFLENVKFLLSHHRGETFQIIKNVLENDLGYKIYYKILDSADFGLPQHRERIYIVGFREDVSFEFPSASPIRAKVKDILEKIVDDRYLISQRYYECLARHKAYHRANGDGWGFEIIDPEGVSNSLVVGRMGLERNLVREMPREYSYREGMDKSAKNSLGLRTLTVRECARLQGFPNNFIFPVSNTQAYKQLGNTVSVPVVTATAKNIHLSLSNLAKHRRSVKPVDLENSEYSFL